MTLILDSSEIREAIRLAGGLAGDGVPRAAQNRRSEQSRTASIFPSSVNEDQGDAHFRGDRLERVLSTMCARSEFSGAVVTDETGLPFAVVNPPVSLETVNALASVLGNALERTGSMLGESNADYLSIDVNVDSKLILRRFALHEGTYFLLALCPQDVDERSEIELSIDQIVSILSEA